jgi:hypothetical protein
MSKNLTSKKTVAAGPTGPKDDPADLAKKINKELEKCTELSRPFFQHAIQVGALLIQAKESVGHGQFYPWLDQNCGLKKRQAQRYMKVAKHRDQFENSNASSATHLTLTAALKALTKGLDGEDEDSSQEQNTREDPEVHHRAKLAEHRKRCKAFKSFRQDETSFKAGPALKRVIKRAMDNFVHDIVKVARRHGKKLTTRELRELGTDQELVAMVLMAEASERLDPVKDFAPKKTTG